MKENNEEEINEKEQEEIREKRMEEWKEEVKEEAKKEDLIKGFPELSEFVYNHFNPSETKLRFSDNRSILRAIMDPYKVPDLRILLSLFYLEDKRLLNRIISTGYFNMRKNYHFSSEKYKTLFKDIVLKLRRTGKPPTFQCVVNLLGLPYSKEFFDEYLLTEDETIEYINKKLFEWKQGYFKKALKDFDYNPNKIDSKIKFLQDLSTFHIFNTTFDSFDSLEEFVDKKENEVQLSTGVKELENKNVKLSKGKISTVFAYTGSYKTMFCTNVAYNIINTKGNILYISLEICKEEMYINFLSRHSNSFDKKISHSCVKNNTISDEDKKYLFEKVYPDFKEKLKKHLIVYDENDIGNNTYSNFFKLFSQANDQFKKDTEHGIDLIIIDHLNLLKFGKEIKSQNDYSVVNHWMSFFRKQCINFIGSNEQVGFLCACQSSREGYKKAVQSNDKKYNLTSIAEGNEIERSSQYVLSILTLDEDRLENKTRMQILKSRDAATDDSTMEIYLEPEYYMFGVETKNKPLKEDKYSNLNNKTIISELKPFAMELTTKVVNN